LRRRREELVPHQNPAKAHAVFNAMYRPNASCPPTPVKEGLEPIFAPHTDAASYLTPQKKRFKAPPAAAATFSPLVTWEDFAASPAKPKPKNLTACFGVKPDPTHPSPVIVTVTVSHLAPPTPQQPLPTTTKTKEVVVDDAPLLLSQWTQALPTSFLADTHHCTA